MLDIVQNNPTGLVCSRDDCRLGRVGGGEYIVGSQLVLAGLSFHSRQSAFSLLLLRGKVSTQLSVSKSLTSFLRQAMGACSGFSDANLPTIIAVGSTRSTSDKASYGVLGTALFFDLTYPPTTSAPSQSFLSDSEKYLLMIER